MAKRRLPRFEVVAVNSRYYVFDYLRRVAHYPPDGKNKPAAFGLRDMLENKARGAGEEVLVLRNDEPNVKR